LFQVVLIGSEEFEVSNITDFLGCGEKFIFNILKIQIAHVFGLFKNILLHLYCLFKIIFNLYKFMKKDNVYYQILKKI